MFSRGAVADLRQINNVADVGGVLWGPWGQELVGLAYNIFNIFCMASHVLTFMICFNVITEHGTCTLVWGVIAVIVFFLVLIPRTLKNVSYLSIVCKLTSRPKVERILTATRSRT